MRHENVKDARRLDALVRLHSTVLDPDLEIRRGRGGGDGAAVISTFR